MNRSRPNNATALNVQQIIGLGRIFILVFMILMIMWVGAVVLRQVDPQLAAEELVNRFRFLRSFPYKQFWGVLLTAQAIPFCIAPLGAIFAVFLRAAFFVKDVYALPSLSEALHYIISSMSGVRYPKATVEAGELKATTSDKSLLDTIGGPGLVMIQPGNVVMFRHLREASNITLRETYFLEPFEMIGRIANLDDQHDSRTGVKALTRDGIKIIINDIQFRYRIFPEILHGRPIRRNLDDPYPFDETALWNMVYNLSVEEKDLESWRQAVGRVIVGGITDFINDHNVDYLTAPRENQKDPRQELRNRLFFGQPKFSLRNIGAELIWIDLGHFAIDNEVVDPTRASLWAAEWVGRAQVLKAVSEERLYTYREQGRAEAQAELIAAIADALSKIPQGQDPVIYTRNMILIRTTQILDTMRKRLESGTP